MKGEANLRPVEHHILDAFDIDLDQANAIEIVVPFADVVIEGDNLDVDLFRKLTGVVEKVSRKVRL